MAKPNKKILVKILKGEIIHIEVWADSASAFDNIRSIEGVHQATEDGSQILVSVDPRYEVEDVAKEIEEMLTAEVELEENNGKTK